MRHHLARRLHALGWHLLCRERREVTELPTLIQPDGTPWRPDISGMPMARPVHF